MDLISKRGLNIHCTQIENNIYIDNRDVNKYDRGEHVVCYVKHNNAAIILCYVSKDTLGCVKDRVEIPDLICGLVAKYEYLLTLDNIWEIDSFHTEFKTSHIDYVNELVKDSQNFNKVVNLINQYINDRNEAKKLLLKQEAELKILLENQRICDIKSKIKNNELVSGRELLDVANNIKFNIPLRTKGLINRCVNINSTNLSYYKTDKPVKDGTNVYKAYIKIKDLL